MKPNVLTGLLVILQQNILIGYDIPYYDEDCSAINIGHVTAEILRGGMTLQICL